MTQVVEWDFDTTNGVSYHKIVLENPVPFVEYGEIAAWGTWFLSTAAGDGVSLDPFSSIFEAPSPPVFYGVSS